MITINLVPKEHKRRSEKKRIYVSIKEALLIILLFASFASILLILSKFYLENKLTELTERNSQGIAAVQVMNNRIKSLNSQINEAYSVQQGFSKLSTVIEAAEAAKGNDVTYYGIKALRQGSAVEISGIAKTRDGLLALQDRLNSVPFFSKVDLPLSSLISKQDNTFNIIIQLKQQ